MPKQLGSLTKGEWAHRAELLSEAYIPYLRERHPMGSVVAINLATAEYVVGTQSPQAMHLYVQRFGKDAEPNMYMEPIHWPNTRSMLEEIDELRAWFQRCQQT